MTSTLAMFPLELVVFPGEQLALHIFEDRYQQLIHDCEHEQITFGIPAYINKKMLYGTEVSLVSVEKRYDTGACDIICQGEKVFRIQSFFNQWGEKLYAGAEISFMTDIQNGSYGQKEQFLGLVFELYDALDVNLPKIDPRAIDSFIVAHKIGLSLEQELQLLKIPSEKDRFDFLIEHLKETIPVVRKINRTKELIKLNGHFKNFDPLDFEEYTLGDL
ncbi:LON peptidase substrate-binding domain-containing protein [Croceiramulus getboli]|nr:LON peptidase substrate-binding domain-containing protein [Flavobacteriaceae bacterium YJPT1-3]